MENKILLPNDYYIVIDDLNITLYQKYMGTNKQGEPIEANRFIGYYASIKNALNKFIDLNIDCELGEIDIRDYVDRVSELKNELLNQLLERV